MGRWGAADGVAAVVDRVAPVPAHPVPPDTVGRVVDREGGDSGFPVHYRHHKFLGGEAFRPGATRNCV
eukprot:1773651-Prymnesium_polylepis.1